MFYFVCIIHRFGAQGRRFRYLHFVYEISGGGGGGVNKSYCVQQLLFCSIVETLVLVFVLSKSVSEKVKTFLNLRTCFQDLFVCWLIDSTVKIFSIYLVS